MITKKGYQGFHAMCDGLVRTLEDDEGDGSVLDSLILAVAVIHTIVLPTGKEQEKLNDWNSQWLQGCGPRMLWQ